MKHFLLIFSLLLFGNSAKSDQLLLTPENTVVFRGEVEAELVQTTQLKLVDLAIKRAGQDYPLYLVMDSPGGGIYIGEQFIQFAKTIPNLKTVTIFAASMASAIVEGLPGERLITENGVLMFHRAKGSFEGQFEEGEVESELALWKTIVRSMEQRNADRMQICLKDYKDQVKDELWIYGKENVEKHAADMLVDVVCSNELIKLEETQSVETMFANLDVVYSGCPLLRAPIAVKERE